MSSLNKVILIGNLTRDPELRYTPSGTALCKFGLAVNRKSKEKEEVTFVDITAWGKTGETASQYLAKGRQVCIEGRLTYSQWEDDGGKKRSKLEVTAEYVTFLGGKGQDSAPAAGPSDDDVPF